MLAIAAIGANFTYGVWFARARANPAFAETALRGVKFIDDFVANPCYLLMLPTGIALVALGGLGFGTHWIAWAMGLWLLAIVVGYAGYSPLLRKQIAIVGAQGVESAEYAAVSTRANIVVAFLAVIIVGILVLMVFKPA